MYESIICGLDFAGTIWVQLSTQDAEVEFRDEIRLYPLVFGGVVCLGSSVWNSALGDECIGNDTLGKNRLFVHSPIR